MQRILGLASWMAIVLATVAAPAGDTHGKGWVLPSAADVQLGGTLGQAYQRGVARLGEDPYRSAVYLRSDLTFEVKRPFTNFSGDISGRFLEIASLTSPAGQLQPAVLPELIRAVADYQQADGHFGRPIDWSKPVDDAPDCLDAGKAVRLPVFWGNSRLLVGLLEAYAASGEVKLLKAARRLGDFYVKTADLYLDPARESLFKSTGTYSTAYVTDYFPAIEGLVRLYQVTKDERYLRQAERMAEFFPRFDQLPIDHSHGNLITYHGLLLLYEATGKPELLQGAVDRWTKAVEGGFVWPTGGVGENFRLTSYYDEGCSEADWLRVNLDLWRITGQTRYLDMAERLVCNHYAMNRMANGGYGHHVFTSDDEGPLAMDPKNVEAVWCCTFHGLLGMHMLKSHVVAGSERGIFVNFPLDCDASVRTGKAAWKVAVRRQAESEGTVTCRVRVEGHEAASEIPHVLVRRPDWAEKVAVRDAAGRAVDAPCEAGYVRLPVRRGAEGEAAMTFSYATRVEGRRMNRQPLDLSRMTRRRGVVLCAGPQVLLASVDRPRPVLVLAVGKDGKLVLPRSENGGYRVATVGSVDAAESQVRESLTKGSTLALAPWQQMRRDRGAAFVFDLILVPAEK